VYVILRVVDNLKTILAPILPHTPVLTHTAQKLHEYLGYEGQLFGPQHVVEYQEEARHGGLRSQQALTYDHAGAICTWTKSDMPQGHALEVPWALTKNLSHGGTGERPSECSPAELALVLLYVRSSCAGSNQASLGLLFFKPLPGTIPLSPCNPSALDAS
jgi:hypothetical protein